MHASRPKRGAAAARGGRRTWSWPLRRVGSTARHLLFVPPDPWPGDAALGRRWLADDPMARGAIGPAGSDPHRFAWLRDLRAVGGEAARTRAQRLIQDWIGRHGFGRQRRVFAAPVLADRLVHWIGQFDFFGKSAPQSFKAPFFRSLAHQARALARVAPRIVPTATRVRAFRALVCFGAAVPGAQTRLVQARLQLQPLLEDWPAHGMIDERNPSELLAILRDFVDIRSFLQAAHYEALAPLDPAITAAGRALAALRHGDGGLALFQGGIEENATFVDVVLALAGVEAARPARYSGGYQRAMRGESVLLFDAAPPPPPFHDQGAHAGTLAFEFSAGAARLVVNCGSYRGAEAEWRDAGRVTAAHSTLVLDDRNSSKIVAGGGLRQRPLAVSCDRQDDETASWIAAGHDGYVRRFGLLHRRRLFLARDGGDLRGEDRLLPPAGAGVPRRTLGKPFAIRFHLHPDVTVGEPERDRAGAVAIPFGSDASGPWHLAAEGRLAATVEESFYLGAGGAPRKTRQLVLSGRIESDAGAEVRWAIRRIG